MKNILLIAFSTVFFDCQDPNSQDEVKPRQVVLNQSFSIAEGETVELENTIVDFSFLETIEDSLCPSDVTCVTMGKLEIGIKIDFLTKQLSIGDGGNPSLSYKDYTIELQELIFPSKRADKERNNSTHAVKMIITESSK